MRLGYDEEGCEARRKTIEYGGQQSMFRHVGTKEYPAGDRKDQPRKIEEGPTIQPRKVTHVGESAFACQYYRRLRQNVVSNTRRSAASGVSLARLQHSSKKVCAVSVMMRMASDGNGEDDNSKHSKDQKNGTFLVHWFRSVMANSRLSRGPKARLLERIVPERESAREGTVCNPFRLSRLLGRFFSKAFF
jgi:hypothetical protein